MGPNGPQSETTIKRNIAKHSKVKRKAIEVLPDILCIFCILKVIETLKTNHISHQKYHNDEIRSFLIF